MTKDCYGKKFKCSVMTEVCSEIGEIQTKALKSKRFKKLKRVRRKHTQTNKQAKTHKFKFRAKKTKFAAKSRTFRDLSYISIYKTRYREILTFYKSKTQGIFHRLVLD